jgi:hypothetical protein
MLVLSFRSTLFRLRTDTGPPERVSGFLMMKRARETLRLSY